MKLKGVIPVLHTTFDNQGNLDLEDLGRLVTFLLSKNIAGLWVLGTGAEDMNLTFEQRAQVAQTVIQVNKDRKPLVIGTSFYCERDTLDFLEFLNRYSLYGVHYMPYHPLISLNQIEEIYKRLAKKSKNPLWIYTSANWCQHIPPSFISSLKGTANVHGVKYSTSNIVHMSQVSHLADDDFNVISAVAASLLPSLAVGVDGATSSLAGAIPEVLIDIYETMLAGNRQSSLEKQRNLNSFMSKWPHRLSKENFLKAAEEKAILEIRGIAKRYTSSYYQSATDEEISQLRSLLTAYYPNLLV